MIPGFQSLYLLELAPKWIKDLGPRQTIRIKVGRHSHDMRIFDRIAGAGTAKQSVGILFNIFRYHPRQTLH